MFSLILAAIALPLAATHLAAQSYSYLPTASVVDDRFLSLAGGGIQTLGDHVLTFKLASPAWALSIEIGIFDGDTYGVFDQGSVPIIYSLYADPEGDGTGTLKIGEWSGDTMTDNGWYTITIVNAPSARCSCGDYFYRLEARSADAQTFHWSSFKLRSDGTVAVKPNTNFTFAAPLGNALDAAVVYPSYPTLTPTTYDGTWHFWMDVPTPMGALTIWDGDLDYGMYDDTETDNDDEDSPNTIPAWATGDAVAEGVSPAMPPDDSQNPVFVRAGAVTYELIAPGDVHYANDNPSGNLEWEQFRVSTEAYDSTTMDHHADVLPAGSYDIAVTGLDLSNLNAMRFPFDIVGVDENGAMVPPIRPEFGDGSISGMIAYEGGQPAPDIPAAIVYLTADYDNDGVVDGTWSTSVDLQNQFSFTDLRPGLYAVTVDDGSLQPGAMILDDTDGIDSPNTVKQRLTMCTRTAQCLFLYIIPGAQLSRLDR